jgi:hypothetical protein
MQITIDVEGIEKVAALLAPQQSQAVLIRWYELAIPYVKAEMRARAPVTLKAKVRSMTDGLLPPKWARIYIKSPLAHLIEGGTGRQGAGDFRHAARHWPSTEGIMRATGLPKPQAFAVAKTIGERGGNPPRPFVTPMYLAVRGHVQKLAEQAVKEVFAL